VYVLELRIRNKSYRESTYIYIHTIEDWQCSMLNVPKLGAKETVEQ
jgi:hypothetical protein